MTVNRFYVSVRAAAVPDKIPLTVTTAPGKVSSIAFSKQDDVYVLAGDVCRASVPNDQALALTGCHKSLVRGLQHMMAKHGERY